jgi:CRISPR type II-A-associated protein Csn2
LKEKHKSFDLGLITFNYFDLSELELLYKELSYQNINLLVIENKKCFETLSAEKVYIVDEDMCEIIEN